jgi:urea carboxylase
VSLFEVLMPGTQTTVQDLSGRTGYWGVGVPPSGAFDEKSFALANLAVGNDPGAAGLEAVLTGPVLRFRRRTLVAVTGACRSARLAGSPLRPGSPEVADPGDELDFGPCGPAGLRGYLAFRGGLELPRTMGSRSTFLLGGFGGAFGRALAPGDEFDAVREENCGAPMRTTDLLPELSDAWELRVVPGPHGAPDYFTADALDDLFAAVWTVDHRSDRTGIRLAGPPVRFARPDGGEAGLHPCNIHDSAYPVGGIMVSGDTPVIVGPDGPSLGGFVVPAAVVRADRWKLGQLRPGDSVRLRPVTPGLIEAADRPAPLLTVPARGDRPVLSVRYSGDEHLLVEAGPPRLDLSVRAWIHLLARAIGERPPPGLIESVEGVRSLLLGLDPARLAPAQLAAELERAWTGLPDPASVDLAVHEVTLPLCFDDPDAHLAMRRYQERVRPDAPWCPDNVEFIRRVNGLASREEVFEIVRAASYLVIGLGDVYLGAPVAVPLDPAHRLVTTKYDPPRTWTAENSVGIGGAYLCVYGMEGPGGYQLVGRTVPVWRKPAPDRVGEARPTPWLLRQFDILRFEPVTHEELMEQRAEISSGRRDLTKRRITLNLASLPSADAPLHPEAAAFTGRRTAAFEAERARWAENKRAHA